MLLKYIKYHNFRPFKGDQMIDLTIPKDRPNTNTIVLLGDNTFGKSTFVLSFIWCLYGVSRFQKAKDILNKKVEDEMRIGDTEVAWVEVSFEDNDIDYVMRRTQKFSCVQGGLVASDSSASLNYITKQGETKKLGSFQSEVNATINSILPMGLSHFFFFEGEKNNEIDKKDLASSVKTLLGLDSFEHMINHMYGNRHNSTPSSSSVMGYYMSKMNSESDKRAQDEYEKKIKAEEELEKCEKRIEEITFNIENYENKLSEINKEIIAAAPSNELKKRRESILAEIRDKEDAINKLNQRIMKIFGSQSFNIFLTSKLPKAQSRMAEMDVVDKGIKGIEGPAIVELLRRGKCLCGTDLSKGTMAYKSVEQYIEYLPPKNVGSIVSEMMDTVSENDEKCKDFAEEFEEVYSDLQSNKSRLDVLRRDEKDVMTQIASIGHVNTEKIENDQRMYKRRIYDLRDEEKLLISKKTTLNTTIENATKKFNEYKSNSDKAKKYYKYYMYAKAVYETVIKKYDQDESNLRNRLSEYISEMFNNMYSGKRTIKIDSKYNIILTANGKNVDDTGGLRVIQYFAYVGGLVKLAKEIRLEKREEEVVLGEQYPLVLDAAFSHADDKHIRSISKELSNATGQLIFALMAKDWQYAEDGLLEKLARKYELKKIDETEVQIVEVI